MPAKSQEKIPFNIEAALSAVETAIEMFPKAALFELAAEGYNSVFEQLIACIISIRTYDETMLPAARRLFQKARTPQQMLELSIMEIDALIADCTFHEPKAKTIQDIAKRAVEEFGGALPCDEEVILSLHGVGPKCANLVLGIACDMPKIGVDIHVHRVTNRWKPLSAKTPEATLKILEEWLPKKHWVDINRLLVPFGKHICTGKLPKCSTCPMEAMCQQVGVEKHR